MLAAAVGQLLALPVAPAKPEQKQRRHAHAARSSRHGVRSVAQAQHC